MKMGKHEEPSMRLEGNQPGCMWGFLHVLGYHRWHALRKSFPLKWHDGKINARSRTGSTSLGDGDSGDEREFVNADPNQLLVKRKARGTNLNKKRLGKLRIKALMAEEMSMHEDRKNQVSGIHFKDNNSNCQVEALDDCLGETSKTQIQPFILLQNFIDGFATTLLEPPLVKTDDKCDDKKMEGYLGHVHVNQLLSEVPEKDEKARSLTDGEKPNNYVSYDQPRDSEDVLEIFKVNRELFLKFLRRPENSVGDNSHMLQSSKRNVRLSKSESFPVAESLRTRNASCFEHNPEEIQAPPSGNMVLSDHNQAFSLPKATKSSHLTGDGRTGSGIIHDKSGRNQLVINHFEDSRLRMKHVIMKNRKESEHILTDAFLHRVPCGCGASKDEKDMFAKKKEGARSQDGINSANGFDYEHHRYKSYRRSSSLNESLDQYVQLFERSFRKDCRLPQSKSLKLTNDDGFASDRLPPKFFKRLLSLQDPDSYSSLQYEACPEAGSAAPSITTEPSSQIIDSDENDASMLDDSSLSTEKGSPVRVGLEFDPPKEKLERYAYNPNIEHPSGQKMDKNDTENHKLDEAMIEDDFGFDEDTTELAEPELKNCHQGDMTSTQFCLAEEEECFSDNTSEACCSATDNESFEDSDNSTDNQFQRIDSFRHTDAGLCYAREVLETVGRSGDYFGAWPSPDQPLDSSVFEELEGVLYEAEYIGKAVESNTDHKVLFDLVNEAVREVHERSSVYWPRALSCSCHIRPLLMGHQAHEKVLARTSRYLSLKPNQERPFDSVAQDFAEDDGWTNIQCDSENVGLELEDLVFDELLGEVLCF